MSQEDNTPKYPKTFKEYVERITEFFCKNSNTIYFDIKWISPSGFKIMNVYYVKKLFDDEFITKASKSRPYVFNIKDTLHDFGKITRPTTVQVNFEDNILRYWNKAGVTIY